MFSTLPKQISATFILFSANVFSLDQSKILSFGKELKDEIILQDFREFMKDNRLAPTSPAVAELSSQLPLTRGIHSISSSFVIALWIPRGSVVECLTHNPGILGSSLTGSSGFFSWECPWARHFRA